MKVVWTDEARAHLAGIHDFIKRDAPFYATQTQMSGSKHRCRGQNTDVGVTQMSGSGLAQSHCTLNEFMPMLSNKS